MIFSITCLVIAGPFLFIDAEKFIDSTLIFFLTRKSHGPKSYYHPYFHIPDQLLFLFPLISLILISVYTLRKESISNYDLVMLLFIEISVITFTNRSFLEQYLFYAIPYLALVFPNILLKEDKLNLSSENISLAASAIIVSNLITFNYLQYFIDIEKANFNDLKLSNLFDYQVSYEIIGTVDGIGQCDMKEAFHVGPIIRIDDHHGVVLTGVQCIRIYHLQRHVYHILRIFGTCHDLSDSAWFQRHTAQFHRARYLRFWPG